MRRLVLRLLRQPYGLLILPLVASALASPAAAQTSPKPPSTESAPPQAAEQAKPNPAGQPEPHSAEAASETPNPAGSQIVINIDKSQQQMTVFIDGVEKYSWPVSTGKRGYSTPSGSYTPTSMNEVWYSKQWDNAPMPHAIFFMKDGHAIHGSYEVKTLGKAVSHGCVRIAPKNAILLYDLVKTNGMQNTKVVLAGETPGGEAKIAEQPAYPRYGEADGAPWFGPGQGYYPPPPPRRGLFGGWFRGPYYGGPQGYYPPPRGYRGY